jgi:peptidoglycan pentaglycine glycine transferase (the first glycine)
MNYRRKMIPNAGEWNGMISHLPQVHLLQSGEWGEFKNRYGWQPIRIAWTDPSGSTIAAAQVLKRQSAPGLSVLYCPRGPLLNWQNTPLLEYILSDLKQVTQTEGSIFLKLEPGNSISSGKPDEGGESSLRSHPILQTLQRLGYKRAIDEVQFRNTMILDLTKSEDRLLSDMKQKTRYNIRLAEKRGVRVVLGSHEDFKTLFRMYAETAIRDNFTIRKEDYYLDVWGSFHHAGLAQPILAFVEGQLVAGLIVFRFGTTAWYLYGMSRDVHRKDMPNYLLQWEAIRWAKAVGCDTYDFWGAPDSLEESDPLWGVYRFKSGFGPTLIQTPGAWDAVAKPVRYRIYHQILPRLLAIMRRRGRQATQQALE